MPFDTIIVRNLRKGPTVMENPGEKFGWFTWGGYGSPDGSDIMSVDAAIQSSPAFNTALKRGIFEVVQDTEETRESLDKQTREYQRETEEKQNRIKESIDHNANRNIDTVSCLGPDARGKKGACQQEVIVSEETPPLCTKHKYLAPQFVSSDEWDGGKKIVIWSQVGIDR